MAYINKAIYNKEDWKLHPYEVNTYKIKRPTISRVERVAENKYKEFLRSTFEKQIAHLRSRYGWYHPLDTFIQVRLWNYWKKKYKLLPRHSYYKKFKKRLSYKQRKMKDHYAGSD